MRRKFFCTYWVFGWIVAAVGQGAWAGLDWESSRFDHTATPDDQKVVTVFRFTNTGDRKVTITGVKTSCGCSTAKLDQTAYEPGEKGQLEVTFRFGHRVGLQRKQVHVETDDPDQPSTTLQLHVEIPKLVSLTPQFTYWRQGGPKTPKTVRLRFDHEKPVQILEVVASDPMITARVQAVEPGKVYRIELSPLDTSKAHEKLVKVRIVTDSPHERLRTQVIYARVMPSRPQVIDGQRSLRPQATQNIDSSSP